MHLFQDLHLAVLEKSCNGSLKRYVHLSCTQMGSMAMSSSIAMPQQKFIGLVLLKTVNSSLILHCRRALSKKAKAL